LKLAILVKVNKNQFKHFVTFNGKSIMEVLMETKIHKLVLYLCFACVFALGVISIVGTGGGGGGGGDSDSTETTGVGSDIVTITGTVAGTVVYAVDQDDNEVDMDMATGTPKTFTLNIPVGSDYRFFFVENDGTIRERVFPLYQGTTNVFKISSAGTIELGFVDTSSGVAEPTNDFLAYTGVSSGGEIATAPAPLSDSIFTISDLEGTWRGHEFSGATNSWWTHLTINVDNTGAFTTSDNLDSVGGTSTFSGTFTINNSGVITTESTTGTTSYHGLTSQDRALIIATMTTTNGPAIGIYQKDQGGTFTQSDLEGTWNIHELGGGTDSWWTHMVISVDNTGTFTSSNFLNSNGDETNISGTTSISSDGIVSASVTDVSSYHGVMSEDRTLIVATMTTTNGPAIGVLQKDVGSTFAQSDLEGTLYAHEHSGGTDSKWTRIVLNIDDTGALTSSSFINSTGDTANVSGAISISTDGIVTGSIAEISSFHGIMSQNKSLTIATMNKNNGPAIGIYQ
jgi:hypothetical protein